MARIALRRTLPREVPPGWRRWLYVALLALLVLATLLANVLLLLLEERYDLSMDLTANAAFRVGPETRALLATLERDVDIYVLATEDGFSGSPHLLQAQRILEQYPRHSRRVRLTYVDYVYDPTFASRYPDLTLAEGNVLVVSGERVKQLALAELFHYTYGAEGELRIVSSRAEEALTAAILYVTRDDHVRVAVLTGHGVAEMPALEHLLTANNYVLAPVNLAVGALDETFDLALLLGPRVDLSEDALRALDAFLYNGGAYGKTLLYTSDVTQEALPNLEAFLAEWGVEVGAGAVFETRAERTYQYQPYYPVADHVDEALRDALVDPSAPMLMPLARPLDLRFRTQGNLENEVLLEFAETSGVRPAGAGEGFTVEDAERWGPLPALVLSSRRIYGTTGVAQFRSNLVVSASTAMLDAMAIQNTSLANGPYLLHLLDALCEREEAVHIQPKSLAGETLAVSTAQANTWGILLAGVLPLGILGAGLTVWLARRYR